MFFCSFSLFVPRHGLELGLPRFPLEHLENQRYIGRALLLVLLCLRRQWRG
eukprot:COSAG02_NODE_23080_length_730_cov_2.288431_2_plen_51_part_00